MIKHLRSSTSVFDLVKSAENLGVDFRLTILCIAESSHDRLKLLRARHRVVTIPRSQKRNMPSLWDVTLSSRCDLP